MNATSTYDPDYTRARKKKETLLRLKGVDISPSSAYKYKRRINRLHDLGFSFDSMALTTGLHPRSIGRLATGQRVKVRYLTKEALESLSAKAIFASDLPLNCVVSSFATLRRFQALKVMGWSTRELNERAVLLYPDSFGIHAFHNVSDNDSIFFVKHLAMKKIYRELSGKTGPAANVAAFARNRGYPPPMAWDDIDNPLDKPKGALYK